MATAPRPGVSKRAAADAAGRVTITLTIRDRTLVVPIGNLPLAHSAALRKVTGGLPPRVYWEGRDAIDSDSLKVLWWMGRRCNGEPHLTVDEMEAEWPDDLGIDEIEVVVDGVTGDDVEDGADPE